MQHVLLVHTMYYWKHNWLMGAPTQALLEDVNAEMVLPESLNVLDHVGAGIELTETVGGTGAIEGTCWCQLSGDQDLPLETIV